ncbi:MAG: hypothetical protein JWM99_3972 [Verrucomicrobiales bacterium]|nr:hypothetical protein [Verrucomicrobiales bacterium]
MRYCEYVRNITVSVDEETYRKARMHAAEQETSVSSLVREHLASLVQESALSEWDRKRRKLSAAFDKAQQKTGKPVSTIDRDEIYAERLKLR